MDSRIKVLHVTPSFYPAVAYGGPIFSTKAITDGVAASPHFQISVLTTDTADPNSRERLALTENPANFPPGYFVHYCRRIAGSSISIQMARHLFHSVRRADVVHLTGPYNFPVIPTLLLCRLAGKPLVWSPRGGFQATAQWSGSPRRRVKVAFERLCRLVRPHRTVLHVTAGLELHSSRNLGRVEAALIPNAVTIPSKPLEREWQPDGRLRLAFLSRIHPKKGLDILIEALAELPAHVTLDVYGAGDEEYLAKLNSRISSLSLASRVAFHGPVNGAAKSVALTSCDLFVLPTYSENFGIVVAEALAHGTPVVVTKGAPWEGIEVEECGRWVDICSEALVEAISNLDGANLSEMGSRGRNWMQRDFSVVKMVSRFESLYRRLHDENSFGGSHHRADMAATRQQLDHHVCIEDDKKSAVAIQLSDAKNDGGSAR